MSVSQITENDVIKSIGHDLKWHSKELKPDYKKELHAAIQYLQELQVYHAIGTTKECQSYKEAKELFEYNNNLAYQQGREDAIRDFVQQLKATTFNEWDFKEKEDYDAMYQWIDRIAKQIQEQTVFEEEEEVER